MRTTVDLPDDLLQHAKSLARGRNQTLSQAVADLMRRGINPSDAPELRVSPITGLPVIHVGGPSLTQADIDAMDDEQDERDLAPLGQVARR